MIIEEYYTKSLIRESNPSIFSWAECYLNPYQGCFHDCRYCDGKSEYYHMHGDFGERIRVKVNSPQLLTKFLKNKGFSGYHQKDEYKIYDFIPSLKDGPHSSGKPKFIINIGGGVCDVYQPAEKQVKMTRKLLEIVHNYVFPVWILTKGKLVLRDLDLLKEINKETYACVNFTITLADEQTQKIFEPKASTTQERFNAIKTLRKEGIHSGVYCYPTLPFIGDTEENIRAIYKQAKEVGAEFVYCFGLTLKPGRNKNEFMSTLESHYPELYPKYEKLYGNNNKYGNLDYQQFEEMGLIWPEIKGFKYGYEMGLDYTAKRYVPPGRISTNLKLSELMLKVAHLKGMILHEPRYKLQKYRKATNLLETTRRDFGTFKGQDFEEIPLPKSVIPIIKEYVEEGRSYYLETLEKEAYEYIKEKYYSN